jgi:histone H3/H4
MNSTLDAEIERIIRAAKQELGNTTARVHKEMRQISTSLKKETGEELARYAVKSKREADMGVQIIGFIKPLREANQNAS